MPSGSAGTYCHSDPPDPLDPSDSAQYDSDSGSESTIGRPITHSPTHRVTIGDLRSTVHSPKSRNHNNLRLSGISAIPFAPARDGTSKISADLRFDLHSPMITPKRSASMFLRSSSSDALHTIGPPVYGRYGSLRHIDSAIASNNGQSVANDDLFAGHQHEAGWYDNFTTIDWLHDAIKDSYRRYFLSAIPGIRGRLYRAWDAAQGWIVIVVVGILFASIVYIIDISEPTLNGWKTGLCISEEHSIFSDFESCCNMAGPSHKKCTTWLSWSELLSTTKAEGSVLDFAVYTLLSLLFALMAVFITLTSNINDSHQMPDGIHEPSPAPGEQQPMIHAETHEKVKKPAPLYGAAGSGVAEVKTILSGFVIRKYLGTYTLVTKSIGLMFSVASGLCVGKEGPFVHIAACVGNICTRLFSKYDMNDGKRREIISAATSAGVALAFGSPLGGVLFSLEEVSYYFPHKTLFRTFFCAMFSGLFLKLLNPYGTGKIVMFEVRYEQPWRGVELLFFVVLGLAGGIFGALFCKLNSKWESKIRKKYLSEHPAFEVAILSLLTSAVCFWNPFTKQAVTEILNDLMQPCTSVFQTSAQKENVLCPSLDEIPDAMQSLLVAFLIKTVLTTVTFGSKVPSGIYIPSMVIGAMFGRVVGLGLQYLHHTAPSLGFLFSSCSGGPLMCTNPGVYAMIAGGAFMGGVTRMTVTLTVILFELTGSLEYVVPFSIAVLTSVLTANAIEPNSVYDLQIAAKKYPFLDPRESPVYVSTLAEALDDNGVRSVKNGATMNYPVIDISRSGKVSAMQLSVYLKNLQKSGESDSGIPVIGAGRVIQGILPGPELAFALDAMEAEVGRPLEEDDMCLLGSMDSNAGVDDEGLRGLHIHGVINAGSIQRNEENGGTEEGTSVPPVWLSNSDDEGNSIVDLRVFVDRTPLTLDVESPLVMAHTLFAKLGLRCIVVTQAGKYYGMLSKKKFLELTKRSTKIKYFATTV
ncbi:hypothetical protein CANCADRAFT_30518 [Tortispora caseinolytica NRRL Y-17796]|uniref:Chloride channel protein n=1 Tax=Tortispora caseinolytica NRRL Y-17796 TaxID=767744 RepID=A0A1E4TKP3_9ASCO|nr:hypothetical protein CANCADRAFT_30518 [Tortispora caseinolytica NRRL Y-17796]